jgi:hypothetical protein
MFQYTDPGKTLKPAKALANYRTALHVQYVQSAKRPQSAFTLLEAFREIAESKRPTDAVEWAAFPKSANASNAQIDAERFTFQDEYVEWSVDRAAGQVQRITFTTDFLAYYEALARTSVTALVNAIKAVIPGANPTSAELYGPGAAPTSVSEDARAARFRQFSRQNPWINGQKGIVCLAHVNNTLGALFGLVDAAAVPNTAVPPGAICALLAQACVPERNSDPSIAAAVQTVARGSRSLSLVDPVGIEMARLGGIWRIGSDEIDINDETANQGVWRVTRQGRRGVLNVVPNLLLDDSPVSSGAQVAAVLRVRASVVSAAEADLPEWARIGQESSQRLNEAAGG